MPIAFPGSPRGNIFQDLAALYRKTFFVVPAPNLGRPGVKFNDDLFHPGIPTPKSRANLPRLGTQYAAVTDTAIVNPANTPLTDRRVYDRVQASLNMVLSGVSKDSTGAVLGLCQVLIFRTEDKSLVAETVSDANGVWSVSMMKGGPFFLVEYLAGSPDRAGTSVNTLVAQQA
jgi:hypothetical protein